MTPEQIEALARQFIAEDWDDHIPGYYRDMNIAGFAAAVRDMVLEEAALACDQQQSKALGATNSNRAPWDMEGNMGDLFLRHHGLAASNCAEAIRALKASANPPTPPTP